MAGPAVQVPGSDGFAGGVYKAVSPVAPMTKARPSGRSTVGPISGTMPGHACGKVEGVEPADTHVFKDGTYFSALGMEEQSTASTVSSGRRVKDSSAQRSPLLGPAENFPVAGSKNAVCESLMLPSSPRPSARMQSGTSPTLVHPLGVARLVHAEVTGSNRVAAATSALTPKLYSPPATSKVPSPRTAEPKKSGP